MIAPSTIRSPLKPSSTASLLKEMDSQRLIHQYRDEYNMDVQAYFKNVNTVYLYECDTTAYQFFYPFSLAGDQAFYEHLQKFEWYYMPWKWEHQTVLEQLKEDDRVLEIGCAQGSFLDKLRQSNRVAIGLELNPKAIAQAHPLSIIWQETVEEHALKTAGYYDVVCSFQVMEHIPHIKQALEATCTCLKKNGRLFISVPNNASFLGLDPWNTLNLPPHHMGKWDEKSLKNLEKVLPLKLNQIYLEPLQEYHQSFFKYITESEIEKNLKLLKKRYGFLGRILFRVRKKRYLQDLFIQYPQLSHLTIIAEYIRS